LNPAGAFIVNTGSCQLIDDCALKQLLIDGTIAGCALDGAEGPQWMEAWVREMPNVLILPRSADYSEEVWMEIREKAITMLQSFFFDGVLPTSAISDEDEEISEAGNEDDHLNTQAKDSLPQIFHAETDESHLTLEHGKKRASSHHKEPEASGKSVNIGSRSEGRRSRSGKKGKKRPAHRRSQQKPDDLSAVESDSNYSSRRDDDTAMSSRDQVVSSSSRFASPEESKYKQKSLAESPMEITSEKKVPALLSRKYPDKLKHGRVREKDRRNLIPLLVCKSMFMQSADGNLSLNHNSITHKDYLGDWISILLPHGGKEGVILLDCPALQLEMTQFGYDYMRHATWKVQTIKTFPFCSLFI